MCQFLCVRGEFGAGELSAAGDAAAVVTRGVLFKWNNSCEVRAYPVSVASPMSCVAAGAFLPRNTTSRTRLPPSEACPAILSRFSWIASESERRIECCVGPRARALEEHQFVACDGHAPPSVLDVLAALRGRTVALVGDSTIQQLWTSLVAELHAARLPLDIVHRVPEYDMQPVHFNSDEVCTVRHDVKPPPIGGSETHFRLDARSHTCNITSYRGGKAHQQSEWPLRALCHSLPDNELSVVGADVRFRFYRVDHNGTKNMKAALQRTYGRCNSHELNFNAKLEAAMRSSDAVMANVGVWYSQSKADEYRSAVRHMIRRLHSMAEVGKVLHCTRVPATTLAVGARYLAENFELLHPSRVRSLGSFASQSHSIFLRRQARACTKSAFQRRRGRVGPVPTAARRHVHLLATPSCLGSTGATRLHPRRLPGLGSLPPRLCLYRKS